MEFQRHEGSGRGRHDHDHDHGAGGHSGHHHGPLSFGRAFFMAICLNGLIVLAQVVFGVLGHSVALIADAGHNLSDVLGLCAAFGAGQLGKRKPSARFTYGLGGTSILAALFNSVFLLVVTGALSWEAIRRFFDPEPVATTVVMGVAAAAVVMNAAAGYLLARSGKNDLNARAAVAHLAADAGVSAGVVVGALLIALTGALWIDPLISLLINATIIVANWGLLRDALAMSLAGVPPGIRHDEVHTYLAGLSGVTTLHDLHIWPVSTSETALTVHLVIPSGHPGDGFLATVCETLRTDHGIGHATMQIETDETTICALASADKV